ncbi:CHAD domain-containing protein [Actinacidiphila acidipaludis]
MRADDGDTGSSTVASGKAAAGASPAVPPPAPDARTASPSAAATARGSGAVGPASEHLAAAASSPASAGPTAAAAHAAPGQRDPGTAAEALTRYLQGQAMAFLRGLSLRGEGDGTWDTVLRGSARRMAGVLHTYAPLTEEAWAEPLRAELGWLSSTLGREPQYATRLDRLLEALRRLSAAGTSEVPPGPGGGPAAGAPAAGGGPLALGAARAAALLERQLTLARTRAHSAALQALGSSRFHALADAVAVLASDVPLSRAAAGPAGAVLEPLAAQAHQRLADAAGALPLNRASLPYNAEAVQASLGTELTTDLQDAPWHQVRILLRLSRYAAEVPGAGPAGEPARIADAGRLLQQHHEAAESASAVAAAARTPRIAPATAYALGVLHADQRHEVEAARFAFSRLWQSGSPAQAATAASAQPASSAQAAQPVPAAAPARAGAAPGARTP